MGELGSGFGRPSEPCAKALSAVPGREDAVVVDRDPLPVCICGRPAAFWGKSGLAFLIGGPSHVSEGLFFGIVLGIGGIVWFGLK
jgi:hypothetical protein